MARAIRSHRIGRGFDSHLLHQNFLIAKDLQIKSWQFSFYSAYSRRHLRLFYGEQETAILNAQPYQQRHFAPLFRQKSLKRSGRKSLEHCCLLSTIYKNCYSKDLVYQIDGAKVVFSPLLLRLLFCQSEVLIFSAACFSDSLCRI